jgi:hypothetical protein
MHLAGNDLDRLAVEQKLSVGNAERLRMNRGILCGGGYIENERRCEEANSEDKEYFLFHGRNPGAA